MEHNTIGDSGGFGFNAKALDSLIGGMSLGTLHEQRFYAIRTNGGALRFPFPREPFTVLVDMSAPVAESVLRSYAKTLLDYGCVQAICRGEDSEQMVAIFNSLADALAEEREGADGTRFTAMEMYDEPLDEAIAYFVLPSGLAQTGLVMVIGDQGDFQNAIGGFSNLVGAAREDIGEPVYTEDDLVCFVSN